MAVSSWWFHNTYTLHTNINKGSCNQIVVVNHINQSVCIENRNIWQKKKNSRKLSVYRTPFSVFTVSCMHKQKCSSEEMTRLESSKNVAKKCKSVSSKIKNVTNFSYKYKYKCKSLANGKKCCILKIT